MKRTKVLFDSNVWQQVVCPDDYTNDKDSEIFLELNKMISESVIYPYISEAIFTLEAINKDIKKKGNLWEQLTRSSFIKKYNPIINTEELTYSNNGDLYISFNVEVNPDLSAHPGNNTYHNKYIGKARSINFKILRCPRIGMFVNRDLLDGDFASFNNTIEERFGEIGRRIEDRGCGKRWIEEIGEKYSQPIYQKVYTNNKEPWNVGIRRAPDSEDKNIDAAFAEWADGDMVSASYAYCMNYICTRDNANNAGEKSILSNSHREWLKKEYNVNIVSPKELLNIIQEQVPRNQ